MRLTEKRKLDQAKKTIEVNGEKLVNDSTLIYAKLGQLEDIEDNIGVPMQLVYEALRKGGILVRNTQGLRRYTHRSRSYLTFGYDEYKGWYFTMRVKGLPQYFIKDYGKTWALTESELQTK